MTARLPLQPTLWRTCRVLANRTRLRIFQLLVGRPWQIVSAIAACLKLPVPVASQSLRALEARGLLRARRVGARVAYRIADDQPGPAQGLARALRLAFEQEPAPSERIFKLATAFAHPRRLAIFHALSERSQSLGELHTATGMSARALLRHVDKLEDRGFIAGRQRRYETLGHANAFGRELARLAMGR